MLQLALEVVEESEKTNMETAPSVQEEEEEQMDTQTERKAEKEQFLAEFKEFEEQFME